MEKIPATLIKLSELEIKTAIAYWLGLSGEFKVEYSSVELYVKPTNNIDGEQEYNVTSKIIILK